MLLHPVVGVELFGVTIIRICFRMPPSIEVFNFYLAGGEKQTERRGHGDGGDPGGLHGFPCSGERPVGEGEAG